MGRGWTATRNSGAGWTALCWLPTRRRVASHGQDGYKNCGGPRWRLYSFGVRSVDGQAHHGETSAGDQTFQRWLERGFTNLSHGRRTGQRPPTP